MDATADVQHAFNYPRNLTHRCKAHLGSQGARLAGSCVAPARVERTMIAVAWTSPGEGIRQQTVSRAAKSIKDAGLQVQHFVTGADMAALIERV